MEKTTLNPIGRLYSSILIAIVYGAISLFFIALIEAIFQIQLGTTIILVLIAFYAIYALIEIILATVPLFLLVRGKNERIYQDTSFKNVFHYLFSGLHLIIFFLYIASCIGLTFYAVNLKETYHQQYLEDYSASVIATGYNEVEDDVDNITYRNEFGRIRVLLDYSIDGYIVNDVSLMSYKDQKNASRILDIFYSDLDFTYYDQEITKCIDQQLYKGGETYFVEDPENYHVNCFIWESESDNGYVISVSMAFYQYKSTINDLNK